MAATNGVLARASRTAVVVLGLAVLATTASFLLSLVQAMRPFGNYGGCEEPSNPVLARQIRSDDGCEWQRSSELQKSDYLKAPTRLRIEERDGTLRTTFKLTLPKNDPLILRIQSSPPAGTPQGLVNAVFGLTMSYTSSTAWQRETVRIDAGSDKADLEISYTDPVAQARDGFFVVRRRTDVQVDLVSLQLGAVRGLDDVTARTTTSLRGVMADYGTLQIAFTQPSGTTRDDTNRSFGAALWRDVQNFGWPRLLAAVPWIALLFCIGWCHPIRPRYRWLLSAAVATHAVLIGAVVIGNISLTEIVREASRSLTIEVPGPYGFAVVPGSVVLLMTALGFLGWYLARPATQARFVNWWTAIGAVLWVAAVLAYGWMSSGAATWVAVAVTALMCVLAGRAFGGKYGNALAVVGALAVPLAMIVGLTERVGALPTALRFAMPWLVAVAALTALARIVAMSVDKTISRNGWVLAVLVAAFLAWPALPGSKATVDNWYITTSFAYQLDAVLPAVLIGVLGFMLCRKTESVRPAPRVLRWFGLGCAFVVLTGAYSFSVQVSWLSIIAAAGFALWLLPKGNVPVAQRLAGLSDESRRRALGRLIRAGEARRVVPALRKETRDKVAAGELTLSEASAKVLEVEREAAVRDELVDGASLRDRAFGTLGGLSAWERARWGVLAGALAGLPWTALSLYGVASTLPMQNAYPLLGSLAVVVPQLVRWAAYGLLFGYFLPLLRGSTGLTKALSLFVAATVPAIAEIIPRGAGSGGWQAVLLVVVQTVSFAMTLGLLADRAVLRSYQHDRARLADVHNLGAVAAWASSLAISAGTALATALIVGLQPFIVGTFQPAPAPAPPAVTAPR